MTDINHLTFYCLYLCKGSSASYRKPCDWRQSDSPLPALIFLVLLLQNLTHNCLLFLKAHTLRYQVIQGVIDVIPSGSGGLPPRLLDTLLFKLYKPVCTAVLGTSRRKLIPEGSNDTDTHTHAQAHINSIYKICKYTLHTETVRQVICIYLPIIFPLTLKFGKVWLCLSSWLNPPTPIQA